MDSCSPYRTQLQREWYDDLNQHLSKILDPTYCPAYLDIPLGASLSKKIVHAFLWNRCDICQIPEGASDYTRVCLEWYTNYATFPEFFLPTGLYWRY